MTKSKLETNMATTNSKYMKHINRLMTQIEEYESAIYNRKIMIKKYEKLIEFLLKEKRVTKSELSKYVTKKNEI